MDSTKLALCALSLLSLQVLAQSPGDKSVPVNADNFVRAESDFYFGNAERNSGGTGKFVHNREPTLINQLVVMKFPDATPLN